MRLAQISNAVSGQLSNVVERVLAGTYDPIDALGAWRPKRKQFYHRVAYGAAGATSFSFFNAGQTKYVTNWPTANGLQNETVFIARSLKFFPEISNDIDAAAVAAGDPGVYDATPATAGEPLDLAAEWDRILRNGLVTLKIGDYNIIDGEYGLTRFPSGGGPCAAFAFGGVDSDLSAGAFGGAAIVNNGVPAAGNVYTFSPAAIIVPQKIVDLKVEFKTALAVGSAFVIRAELDGDYIAAANQ